MTGAINGLIRSARLGMAPTLVSNALVAWACVTPFFPRWDGWWQIAQVVLMGACFFLYGMWENDRVDARWDRKYRPSRPVPRGEVSTWTLRQASLVAGLAGLIYSSVLLGQPILGVLLLVVISFYNWLHKATAWSIVLMGACRGVWALGAMMVFFTWQGADIDAFGGGAYRTAHCYIYSLTLYTIIASWVARGEAGHPRRKAVAGFLLSSMSLHDAVWLAFLGRPWLSVASLGCYGLIQLLRLCKHRTT